MGYMGALIVGLTLGLLGGGGSILTVPLMVYVIGVNPVTARPISFLWLEAPRWSVQLET